MGKVLSKLMHSLITCILQLKICNPCFWFNRYISSDCDSLDVMFKDMRYEKTPEEVTADALNAGNSSGYCIILLIN